MAAIATCLYGLPIAVEADSSDAVSLRHSLALRKGIVIAAEPVELAVRLENTSSVTIELYASIRCASVRVGDLTGASGESGDQMNPGFRLKPGEVMTIPFFLTSCIENIPLGRHAVSVSVQLLYGPLGGNLSKEMAEFSGEVAVEVGRPEDEQTLVDSARARLKSLEADERRTGAKYLAYLNSPRAAPLLLDMIDDHDEVVVENCLRGLSRHPVATHGEQIMSLISRPAAVQRPARTKRLVQYLATRHDDVYAVRFGEIVGHLLETSRDPMLTIACLKAMSTIGGGYAEARVHELSTSTNEVVRALAVAVLAKGGRIPESGRPNEHPKEDIERGATSNVPPRETVITPTSP